MPAYGIYAGAALGHRAAISIGINPHYGGLERRIEAFLLDFEGDLYGSALVVELWQRLRDERAFESEQELVDQIAADVDARRGNAASGLSADRRRLTAGGPGRMQCADRFAAGRRPRPSRATRLVPPK